MFRDLLNGPWDYSGLRKGSQRHAPVNPNPEEAENGEPSVLWQPGLNSEILPLNSLTTQMCGVGFYSTRNVKEREARRVA